MPSQTRQNAQKGFKPAKKGLKDKQGTQRGHYTDASFRLI